MQLMCLFVMLLMMLLFVMSDSMFLNWMLMEISTLSYISFMILGNDNKKVGSIAMYMFIQVLSSSMFFISFIFFTYEMSIFNSFYYLYNLSMLYKIGLFPFHVWVVNLTYSLDWMSILFLGTTQKFIPMLMLNYMFNYSIVLISSIMSMFISMYFSLGLKSVKLIFSYSMISQSSWMLLMMSMLSWWFLYFFMYMFLFSVICLFNKLLNLEDFTSFVLLGNSSYILLLLYSLNFVSLMGLPPMNGFLMKFMLLNYYSVNLYYMIMVFVVLSSLIHLYMYMQVVIQSIMFFSGKSMMMTSFFMSYFKMKMIMGLMGVSLILNMLFIFVVII